MADQTYKMCNLEIDSLVSKENANSRKSRKNKDECKLRETLQRFNVFGDNQECLNNIATKYIATGDIQESLIIAEASGEECLKKIVKKNVKTMKLEVQNSTAS